jgi:hypothetical protein
MLLAFPALRTKRPYHCGFLLDALPSLNQRDVTRSRWSDLAISPSSPNVRRLPS